MSPRQLSSRASCAVLLSALFLSACGGDGGAPPQAPPPEVTVATLTAAEVTLTRELPGRTRANLIAEVRPQVSGIVKRRLFEEGSLVEAGQPLYQIDDATYRAEYNSALANLARARATAHAARLQADRMTELIRTSAISARDEEAAAAAAAQADADVKAMQAAVAARKVQLDYARIVAPISGRIGRSTVTAGALVTANQPAALATVQQLDPIYVDLTQSASELLELRRAMATGTLDGARDTPVQILLDDGSAYSHPGNLEFSEVSVDPGTGSFGLRVLVDNPDELLLPGMYVRAVIGLGTRHDAILVPQQGVARDAKGATSAMVVDADGLVALRPVRVSQTVGDQWLVEEGLQAGDQVIIEGLQKVQPGIPVRVVQMAPASTAAPAAHPDDAATDVARQ